MAALSAVVAIESKPFQPIFTGKRSNCIYYFGVLK